MKSRSRPRQWKRLYQTEAPISLAGTGAFVDSEATLHSRLRQQVAERETKPVTAASCRPPRSSRRHEDAAGPLGLLHGGENGGGARDDPRGRSEVAGADELPEPCSGTVPSHGFDVPPYRISGHGQSGRSECSPPPFMTRVSNGASLDMDL